jgi:hypothetical protein
MEIDQERIHCGGCNKNLVDFRGKSVEETVEIIAQSGNDICGVYDEHKTEAKAYIFPKFSFTKRFAAAALLALGLFPTWAEAQLNKHQHNQVEYVSVKENDKEVFKIKGKVKNLLNGNVIKSAVVKIIFKKELIIKTYTDAYGEFELDLPFTRREELLLEIEAEQGLAILNFPLYLEKKTFVLNVFLASNKLGEVIILEDASDFPITDIVGKVPLHNSRTKKDINKNKRRNLSATCGRPSRDPIDDYYDKMWSGRTYTRKENNWF